MSVPGITQNTAAEMAGVTQVTIHRHVKNRSIKTLPGGRIDPKQFAEWLKERTEASAPKQNDGSNAEVGTVSDTLTDARKREVDLKADKLALELEEKAGKMVPADQVQWGYDNIYARARSHIKAFKAKIPGALGIAGKNRHAAMIALDKLEREFLLALSAVDDNDEDDTNDA